MLLPHPIAATLYAAALMLLLCVLGQFASATVGIVEEGGIKGVKTFMDEIKDGKQIFEKHMQRDFGNGDAGKKEKKITEEAREVGIGLMASLFPEPTVEKGRLDVEPIEERVKDIFKNGLFDTALPDMILRRIDQLALRPHMEELAKQLDEADAADEEEKRRLKEKEEKREKEEMKRAEIRRSRLETAAKMSSSYKGDEPMSKAAGTFVYRGSSHRHHSKKQQQQQHSQEGEEQLMREMEEAKKKQIIGSEITGSFAKSSSVDQDMPITEAPETYDHDKEDHYHPGDEQQQQQPHPDTDMPELSADRSTLSVDHELSGHEHHHQQSPPSQRRFKRTGNSADSSSDDDFAVSHSLPDESDPRTQRQSFKRTGNSADSSSDDDFSVSHSLPDESDPRTQRHSVQLYRAVQAIRADSNSSTKHTFTLASKQLEMMVDELTVAELGRKVDIQLRKRNGERLYVLLKSVAEGLRKISSDNRFAQLNIVTKVRLFFYHWLQKLISHLDAVGHKRADLYRTGTAAYKHEPGHTFQLYLADWLQNGVLNPLEQRILLDLVDHQQGSWEPLLPFCVHMSLRPFFNYAERFKLVAQFSLDRLILSGPTPVMVENFLNEVIEKLTRQGKTAKELVKLIRDEIFANLPLPDGAMMKLRLKEALLVAANGLGSLAANKRGDKQVLLQFFVRFYQELNTLASPKWLQALLKTLSAMRESEWISRKRKTVAGDEHAVAVVNQEQQKHHHGEDGDKKMKPVAEKDEQHEHKQEQQRQQLRKRRRQLGKEPEY